MRKTLGVLVSTFVLLAPVRAQEPAKEAEAPKHFHLTPAELKWGPAPPFLPKGAVAITLAGDPAKPGPFVLRLKAPAGYRIAPHWHPNDENVTVLSGTFALGMGEKFDPAALKAMPAGTYSFMPAQMRHFAMAKTATTIQVHGVGPFTLNYVDPADDPTKQQAPTK